MDTERVLSTVRKYWADPHQSYCQTVSHDWPQWERTFTTLPLLDEYEATFRRYYDAGHKTPPPWETVKRSIFAARRKAAEARAENAAACKLCHGGLICVMVHYRPDGRQVPLDPRQPAPVPSRRLYRVVVPCTCDAGSEANMGCRQNYSDILDGQAKRPGYGSQARERLQGCRIDPRAEREYRDQCQALFIEAGGWPEYTARYGAGVVSDATAAEVAGDPAEQPAF